MSKILKSFLTLKLKLETTPPSQLLILPQPCQLLPPRLDRASIPWVQYMIYFEKFCLNLYFTFILYVSHKNSSNHISGEECKDIQLTRKCKQAVKKGHCDRRGPKANCKKTCGLCTPDPLYTSEPSSTDQTVEGISKIIAIYFSHMIIGRKMNFILISLLSY